NDGLGEIGYCAFAGTAITEISIPETVTKINDSFCDLKSLKTAVFKGSRSEIPERSFYCCTGLETITFPDSLMSIEAEAFYGCEGLKKLTVPSGVRTIGYQTFKNCKNLIEIELNDELGEIGYCAFAGTAITEISIPETVTKINDSFSGLKTLKTAVFKGSRSEIPERSFYCCPGLETITFPDSLMSIEAEAFYGCEGLRKLTIPSGVKTIGYQTFKNCKNLTEFELNDGLEEIGYCAFSGTALKEISIPESLKVCNTAFSNTDTLKKVVFRGKRTIIPEYAFSDCKYIMEFTVPADTTYIYMNALSGCKSLQTLKILNSSCVMDGKSKISDYLTIYGYDNSTAQKYAEEYNYKFALLEDAPVIAESPAPSPSPTPATSPDPSPASTPTASPDPSPVPTPVTSPVPTPVTSPDPSPVPTSSSVPTTEVEVIPVEDADMNDDSVITMADYVTLIKRILTANVEYDAAFDINKDNKIDAADVITLRKVFLGTVVCE
ncbi:MAG: leucine-rich repeat protein, partial [Oscillospiraceae bacterium]|nr:leucine-rich repeat protein [Oscillospiraceae bacterium]